MTDEPETPAPPCVCLECREPWHPADTCCGNCGCEEKRLGTYRDCEDCLVCARHIDARMAEIRAVQAAKQQLTETRSALTQLVEAFGNLADGWERSYPQTEPAYFEARGFISDLRGVLASLVSGKEHP